jgi:hypothetical protein
LVIGPSHTKLKKIVIEKCPHRYNSLRGASIGDCTIYHKIGEGPINVAPSATPSPPPSQKKKPADSLIKFKFNKLHYKIMK